MILRVTPDSVVAFWLGVCGAAYFALAARDAVRRRVGS